METEIEVDQHSRIKSQIAARSLLSELQAGMEQEKEERQSRLNLKGTHKIIHYMIPHCPGDWFGGEEKKAQSRIDTWVKHASSLSAHFIVIFQDDTCTLHNDSSPLCEIRCIRYHYGTLKKHFETIANLIFSDKHTLHDIMESENMQQYYQLFHEFVAFGVTVKIFVLK
jgi:hypothetical protein